MRKSVFWIFVGFSFFLLIFCWGFSSFSVAGAEIVNPEEALSFLKEMVKKSTDRDY